MDNDEIDLIKTAILNEIECEFFYRRAARETQSQEAVNTFLGLAEDEKRHQRMLKGMLTQMQDDIDFQPEELNPDGKSDSSVFNAAHNIDTGDAMEVSLFNTAVMMENASIDYYRRAAAQTSLPATRDFFKRMIDWQLRHLEALEKVYEFLTQEWWDKQSYSPS